MGKEILDEIRKAGIDCDSEIAKTLIGIMEDDIEFFRQRFYKNDMKFFRQRLYKSLNIFPCQIVQVRIE